MKICVYMVLLQSIFVIVGVKGQGFHNFPTQQNTQLKIGALFDHRDTKSEIILKQAVEHINRDPSILPNHQLSVVVESINSDNSFQAESNICKLLKLGVVGIFGPQTPEAATFTQAICDRYDIPHVETRRDYLLRQDKYGINLFPHPDVLGEAFTNFVNRKKWNEFVIIYMGEYVFSLHGLLKSSMPLQRNITMRRLGNDGNHRPLLKSLQRDHDVKKIIIDCQLETALQVLKQAQEIGMIRFDYQYILTTLDLQPMDLEEFRHGDAKIWSFRMIDPDRPEAVAILAELDSSFRPNQFGSNREDGLITQKPRGISTADALIHDAVRLFAKALHDNADRLKVIKPVTCNNENSWSVGSSIINSMRSMTPFRGLTGIVQFNNSGFRTDIVLELIELASQGVSRVDVWEYARDSTSRLTCLEPEVHNASKENDLMPLSNRTLTVVTIMTMPLCMHALSEDVLVGNARFVGFTVDLLKELSDKLGFNYTIKLVEDGTHDGIITEIQEEKADIGVGDLTVTKERQQILDFTMPFMNLGISILFTMPQAKPPDYFSFMSPFGTEVWIFTIISFFGVSMVLFGVGRFTPYEWENSFPCVSNPEVLQNQFSLANSFFFTIGSIMQQGSDLAPKSISTRMIAATWWCFTLIMVSSYTANLATFLIVQELEYTFSTLDELAGQSKIEYGCVVNGSTMKFFEKSNESTKQAIWNTMKTKPLVSLKATNDEGIKAVRSKPGRYAFFMESTIIEYHMERKCGLTQVGGLLDHKGYGIALNKKSRYLDLFNGAILQMQENGDLDRLKRKWWKEEGKEESETCPTTSVSDTVKPLGLSNVGGVFVVLVCGCIGAIFITLIEYGLRSRRERLKGESLFHATLKDLYFALQCRGNVKPVKKNSAQIITGAEDDPT